MKSTGIVRKIDNLGRIVIPIETRRNLGMDIGYPLEIYVGGDQIILKKYTPGCSCCSNIIDLITVNGISLCPSCLGQFIGSSSNATLKECNHD